jgi:hypothetical protein
MIWSFDLLIEFYLTTSSFDSSCMNDSTSNRICLFETIRIVDSSSICWLRIESFYSHSIEMISFRSIDFRDRREINEFEDEYHRQIRKRRVKTTLTNVAIDNIFALSSSNEKFTSFVHHNHWRSSSQVMNIHWSQRSHFFFFFFFTTVISLRTHIFFCDNNSLRAQCHFQ